VESMVRARVGTNRLENAGSSGHRFAATGRDSFVPDTPDVGSRRRPSYRLSGRCDRFIRSNRGTVSGDATTHNGDARVAGTLFARRAAPRAASDSYDCAKVA